jgi:hypothetical protein
MHGLIVGLDRMHPAFPTTTGKWAAAKEPVSCKSFTWLIGFPEPRSHSGKHSHETTGLQQLSAELPAGTQVVVELFLIHLIHVQQTVCGLPVEGRILYIFPDNAGSLLLAATEEASAVMMVLY